MASRRRLGVALVVEGAVATEIDGLRRALGDPSRLRIAPHVTLVPPVNVRHDALAGALAVVRAAASSCGRPLSLHLGPPSSFLPANPVLHLAVGGDLSELRALRDALFVPPLARELSWPWVPHVTLSEGLEEERLEAALVALGGYQVVTRVERVVLLELRHDPDPDPGLAERGVGRRWIPLADAALAPAAVVGRGGLELTMVEGRVVGPDALELLARVAATESGHQRAEVVVSGLVDGALAGVAVLGPGDDGPCATVVVDPDRRRCGLGRALLARLAVAAEREEAGPAHVTGVGPAGFYLACGDWARPS